jgi:hypothetical protein
MFAPLLLLWDDVFEIWVVGFVGFDAVGAECEYGYAFVGVIAIPEGLGWGDIGVCEYCGEFGFLDYEDVWVMCKDGGVFGEEGGLGVLGDEGHGEGFWPTAILRR